MARAATKTKVAAAERREKRAGLSLAADIARDLDGDPVFLAENAFSLNYEADRAPGMVFKEIKDYQVRAKAA